MAEKIRYNKIIDLLEHGKPVFSTSTVPNGSLDDLTYIADADYDPDSSERRRAQPVGDQIGAGQRRVWSGVAPPEHAKLQSRRHAIPRCGGCKTLHRLGSAVGAIASPPDTGA